MFKIIKEIIRDNIKYRAQIFQLARVDQKKAYKGSDLGRIWSYVKPAMYVIGFYLAISIGFKSSKNIEGIIVPYFVWLTVGLISWFYMRDMLIGGAACFKKHRYLVLKSKFPVNIIPTIPAVQNLIVHGILMIAVFILAIGFGARPNVYWLQLPLYAGLMFLYAVIWSFTAGLLSVVSRDFYNLLRSVTTMIFWLSGVMFDSNAKGIGNVIWFFRFNPITFTAEGYRNALCREVWFFEEPLKMACYLSTMLVVLIVGLVLYKKIGKQLPDIV